MANVTIYHNPRCSKSRQTLGLIEDKGINPTIVEYLTVVPSVKELTGILKMLGKSPAEIIRKKEAKEEGVDIKALSDKDLIQAMHDHPRIIERPIVVVDGKKAAMGRPPEQVLEII